MCRSCPPDATRHIRQLQHPAPTPAHPAEGCGDICCEDCYYTTFRHYMSPVTEKVWTTRLREAR